MLVLAPAACILSGIALSECFDVLTRSIKFNLYNLFENPSPIVSAPLTLLFFLHFITFSNYVDLLLR